MNKLFIFVIVSALLLGGVCTTAGCIEEFVPADVLSYFGPVNTPSHSGQSDINSPSQTVVLPDPTLSLSSNPSGASVYLDNKYVGITPLTVTVTPNTSAYVEIKKNGYRTWSSYSQSLEKGRTGSMYASLEDLLIGSWRSDLGTSYLYISSGGSGTKSVMGFSSSVSWRRVTDGTYVIDGSQYSLSSSGNVLSGPIATYRRM